MKISAMPANAGGTPGVDLQSSHIGVTASADRLAAAKAIAQGLEPEAREQQSPLERLQSVRKIKMRTNVSPDRYTQEIAEAPEVEAEAADSTILDAGGQTNAAAESTQPLSPQFAALAKERRALQVMKKEIADEKAKLSQPPENAADLISKADLLANPLKIFDLGLTYDQLTEAILASQSGNSPEIKQIREELKALKEGTDNAFKSQETRQEEAALNQMLDQAETLAKEGDTFEMIRSENAYDQVLNKIYTTYKKTGQVPNLEQVMNEVENNLLERSLRYASYGKVRSKLAPEPVQQPQSQGKQMRTLTNRDGASIPMDRKARAIAAMNGTLRK